ncbi:hypothetical protein VPH35_050829 [Triticum aestivum]
MSCQSPTTQRTRAAPPLPAAVGAELARLEARLGQCAGPDARQRLAGLGEAAAARVLRTIAESRTPVKTLSGFIRYLADKADKDFEMMQRNARSIPPAESAACCSSGPSQGDDSVSGPQYHSDDQVEVQSPYTEEIAFRPSNHAGSPSQPWPISLQDNMGPVREIVCIEPNVATMAANTPSGRASLQIQDDIQINDPIRAMTPTLMPATTRPRMAADNPSSMTPAMMPVPTLPWMAGENPRAWIPLLNLDYAPTPDVMMQGGSPGHCVSIGLHNDMRIESPIPNAIHTPPRSVSTPSPVRDLSRPVQRMVLPSGSPHSPAWAMAPSCATYHATENALREKASPQMQALEELEFMKRFMICAYLRQKRIEDELSVDYIRSLKHLSIVQFESEIWRAFGCKYIKFSDRVKNLDSDPGATRVYHCIVEITGDSVVKVFKGPYVQNTRTHLQKNVGDDNVLLVKFMGPSSESVIDFLPYHKVAEDGIILGLRRYRFFVYKDGGKDEKKKEEKINWENKNCASGVKCYFVRTESGWNMDEPYILSGKTINQARKLFMHIHTAPTLAKYMARFALILSKTITMEVDLSALHVIQLDDKPCSAENGGIVQRDGELLIHTDGTGLISEDLAEKCPTIMYKGKLLKSQDVQACDDTLTTSPRAKKQRLIASKPPLLIQFRMFYKGSAVKGTALIDRRLPPGTILIRPSMIKIKSDPKLCGVQSVNSWELIKMKADPKSYCVQSVNSLEIVTTSTKPKRTLTSKLLIALLRYGGVKEEFFMELLENAIEGAENARCDYEDALNIAFIYADMEDSISARMILSGIPLEDAYLQSRLAIMAQQERKGIKQGKLPISDCFYLMGTTDSTGKLKANEVCVILDNGPYCGNVLVYKHPGLHFGDIHVLTSRYIEDIHDVVGYSRYAILFPTSGPRSLADEMANSDFDGDMYWVSINEQLLKQFKPSKPWEWGQVNKPIQAEKKCLLDLDEPLLDRSLFHEFLKARFARSNALGTAADSWLVYMDRLLTDGVDEDESNVLEKKIKKLVDLYYLALDAPKARSKINVPAELTAKKYPHYMDRKESYHSTSILGKIYDEAEKKQSEKVEPVEISLDPRFTERAASSGYKYLNLWTGRYHGESSIFRIQGRNRPEVQRTLPKVQIHALRCR